jgi:ABC-2 type transport system ATP-binding protein
VASTIELDGATKTFDGRTVVADLSFRVDPGAIVGLIGPSGSGKTTTVRMVLGVHPPDQGRVLVFGGDPRGFGVAQRQRIGYMPQHFVLYPELSVEENLNFMASCYGVSIFHRGRTVRQMLDLVELGHVRKRPAGSVSGGEQRRLELACTLVHNPELVVMDEPTAGVDPVLRQKFWDHFRALRDQGRTLLVTTQYVTEAEYCDQVVAIRGGRLAALGEPDAVRREAMGGDVLRLQAADLTRQHLDVVARQPGVADVVAVGPDEIRITVDDAGQATPRILAALERAGLSAQNLVEYRPNFDEVFVRLMEQRDAEGGGPPDEAARRPAA